MIDYDKVLCDKIVAIKPSGIRRFFDLAAEMDDVISLGVGEPDFKTPWVIRKAGMNSLEKGRTWYTANSGLMQLREEVANYLDRRIGVRYDAAKETMITVGGSEGIDILTRALINPGDEVIVPDPCYVSYAPIADLSGAKVVYLKTTAEDEFRINPKALKEAITDKTKLLVFPFPNNPTGAVMEREHLEEIAEVLRDTNVIVMSDEIYSELSYGIKHTSIASIEGMRERTVIINGFSKAYAMTGWRLGYAAGPEKIISQMLKIHQFAIMCAPTTSQFAAVVALKECDEDIEAMRDEYNMRRKLIVERLNRMGLSCFEPKGAFYVFPSIKSTGLSSTDFCEQLLFAEKLAVVPGNAFGEAGEGFVRISYSYSVEHLMEALKRIERFIRKIEKERNEK